MRRLSTAAKEIRLLLQRYQNYPAVGLTVKPKKIDALVNVKDAIQLWIDTAKKFGDPIPEPKGRRLMLA
jgi:hypothetical protein